jgi:nucleoside-diphosphate-sugar epimerase
MPLSRLLILGCGYTGSRVLQLARSRGREVVATLRRPEPALPLRGLGVELLIWPELDERIAAYLNADTHVVVCFPANAATDTRIAPLLAAARSVVYISSTGVYGARRGVIDDASPLPDAPDARAQRLLDAENCYRAVGACVLRSPAIYGPDRGVHVRILRGEHRIPGDGSQMMSRVHVEDLAQITLAAADSGGQTFVVGDREPARHIDVVRFVSNAYRVPMPEFVPLEDVHGSLRADRQVDATRVLSLLGVHPRYPSYREGMDPAVTGLDAVRAAALRSS